MKCAIQYLLDGETYTFTSCTWFDEVVQAVNWFKMYRRYDKIVCVFVIKDIDGAKVWRQYQLLDINAIPLPLKVGRLAYIR